jgi:hypothetical protein
MPRKQRFHGGYDFDFGPSRKYRRLLDTPIRLRGVPDEQRDEYQRKEVQARWDAAYELYGIPADTAEPAKSIALAARLLGEHFKGCRTLLRQPGGSPIQVGHEEYIKLADDFDATTEQKLTDIARADIYLKRRKGVVKIGIRAVKCGRAFKVSIDRRR